MVDMQVYLRRDVITQDMPTHRRLLNALFDGEKPKSPLRSEASSFSVEVYGGYAAGPTAWALYLAAVHRADVWLPAPDDRDSDDERGSELSLSNVQKMREWVNDASDHLDDCEEEDECYTCSELLGDEEEFPGEELPLWGDVHAVLDYFEAMFKCGFTPCLLWNDEY